jgi:copper chaperone
MNIFRVTKYSAVETLRQNGRELEMTAMPDRAENILVKGMTCNHCVQSVTAALTKLPGITGVRVDLSAGRVSYENPDGVERDRIAAAVRQAGFDAQ